MASKKDIAFEEILDSQEPGIYGPPNERLRSERQFTACGRDATELAQR